MRGTEIETLNTIQSDIGGDRNVRQGIQVWPLVSALARQKAIIIYTTGLALLVALLVSFLIPGMYEANTTIMPPQQVQSASTALLGQLAPLASLAGKDLGLANPAAVYISILKSRTIQDSLITKFELVKRYRLKRWSDVRKELRSRTEVSEDRKSGVITIAVVDEDPRTAALIANAYVEELRQLTSRLAVTEAARRRVFFEREVQEEKRALASAENNLRKTQEATGLIQLDSQAKAIIESVARVRSQIATKEVELQAIGSFATPENPDYVRLQQQLLGLRSQLTKMERSTVDGVREIGIPTGKVPEAGLMYVRSLREVKYHEMLFEVLAKQFEAAKIDEAKEGALIQVIDYAITPDRKVGPSRLRTVLLVCVSVFILVCGAVGYREYQNQVNTPKVP
ncbi:MAG TPA: Wzz/FepE/Etk N-terminal domain-containing protein [Terriglobales bacterium]|nr:Wzz/FepE/Etk N-terminal domain-containing protein [Terriglobales bacterium]